MTTTAPASTPARIEDVLDILRAENRELRFVLAKLRQDYAASELMLEGARQERDDLRALLNAPETRDFVEAVKREAAHQRTLDHRDETKTDAEWMWTVGWLIAKAVHATTLEKRLHHLVTSAAALANWHRLRAAPTTETP